jgi:hypothetical protein
LEDLKKIISALNENNAEYVLIGGYALHAHGYVRATEDIDIMIPSDQENGKRIINALSILSDNEAQNLPLEWFDEDETIRLADEIVIDLIFKVCGETYKSLYKHKQIANIGEIKIPVLDYEGLVKTKKFSIRQKDKSDIEILTKAINIEDQ